MNVIVSACLLGVRCRYDGKNVPKPDIISLKDKVSFVPVCPEIFGGLPTPRMPAERRKDKIVSKSGIDVTAEYIKGAEETLRLAKMFDCKFAILKARSPSCGYGKIYNGTFSNTITDGSGVTAELLIANGIKVFGESEIERFIMEIENYDRSAHTHNSV